ncbi:MULTISPECIES: dioxygenase family protein [unclassified Sphingomonas]|uniref:dioxygenase family protein n=1 Tax=unclassified Sphingomonas TaxID=196159 RepID=UPI0022B2BC38|nr:intradiol ring-cleavage dioxygenase [Sphingomonas sp. NIBR02145]WHU02985.1 intradiol ring-cleavage dioxygenase [Sphingomonas sp. NIBR02145]
MEHHDEHDLGLAHDLKAMTQLASRRRALGWFAGASGAAMLAACDGGSSGTASSTSSSGTTTTATPTPTASATATPTPTATSTSSTCVVDPTETNGPYPADGTNTSSGATSNVLTASNVVRSDIRSSFVGSSTTTAAGVQVTLTLTLVNVNAACAPLAGYAIYIWHCDRDGKYSLYDLPAESYLRGVGVTDSNGQVTFTTIFPGCYSGRWPHIHFEVFSSLANATGGRYATLISQLAMPSAACSTVYNNATGYSTSIRNFASVSINSDNVFGDNTSAQIAQQTPVMSGSVAAGYTATAVIGIAR